MQAAVFLLLESRYRAGYRIVNTTVEILFSPGGRAFMDMRDVLPVILAFRLAFHGISVEQARALLAPSRLDPIS